MQTPIEATPLPPARTVRAVSVALVARGKAVDLALVETDGAEHVRLVETERQPLQPGPILAAVVHATRAFMGDRTLQPFALDLLVLVEESGDLTAAALASGIETEQCVVPCVGAGTRGSNRVEQAAFAAIAAFVAAGLI